MQTLSQTHKHTESHSETPNEKWKSRCRRIIAWLVRVKSCPTPNVQLERQQTSGTFTAGYKRRQKKWCSQKGGVGTKERDGWDRWVAMDSFTSVHVRNLWHQCSDATAAKNPQKCLLNMHVCSFHVGSTMGRYGLIRALKLAGWVLLPPHPLQKQKNRKRKKEIKDAFQCSLVQQL